MPNKELTRQVNIIAGDFLEKLALLAKIGDDKFDSNIVRAGAEMALCLTLSYQANTKEHLRHIVSGTEKRIIDISSQMMDDKGTYNQ